MTKPGPADKYEKVRKFRHLAGLSGLWTRLMPSSRDGTLGRVSLVQQLTVPPPNQLKRKFKEMADSYDDMTSKVEGYKIKIARLRREREWVDCCERTS